MKILMIAPQPFFEPRGTPISIYQRLYGLSRLGYEVDLLTIHLGMDVSIPNVTIHRTPCIPFINQLAIGPSLSKLFLDVLLFLKALLILFSRHYDVIHSHEEAAFYTVLLSLLSGVPHVYDMHSSLPKQLRNFNFGNASPFIKLFEILERAVMKTCAVTITIGADLEAYVLEVHPGTNHIRVENTAVHNALPSQVGAAAEIRQRLDLYDKFAIVYAGNFEQYQGLDLLFESARQLVKDHPNLVLIMVGGKPGQIARYRDKTTRLGLADHIIFVGTISLIDSLAFLEVADILVSPRTEGLSIPIKIYTYLYSGKPTLATNIYAHTQLLTEDIALLVEPTVESYATGLRRLITDSSLRDKIGQNARAFAIKVFSMDDYLAKLEQAYLAASLSKSVEEIVIEMSRGKIRSTIY